ncbi:MAG: hypothetical protein H6917_13535 [Novosphingobium sp.]|nr:hypothetical protein [Novosphingobium sp.]MCP5403392.1 hypothetical protein [Novosphingobium sp.]
MSDTNTTMSQENFAAAAEAGETAPADFSSDDGALAYAYGQLDKLVEAMRYSLRKQIVGWPDDDRELNTYEALRHMLRNMSFGHAAHVEADYGNPTLTKMGGTNRIQFQLQSTDCNYHTAVLHGAYRYRLRGNRGTCAVFQLSTFNGHSCDFADGWKMIANANNVDTPQLAPGKQIDVILSHEKPGDLGPDQVWLELPEGRCEMHMRQYYADWFGEQPADLMLTCEEQVFPPPLLDRDSSETRFKRLVDLLRVHADFCEAGVKSHLASPDDRIARFVVPGAFAGTDYFSGQFRVRPDEAVIIEIDRPDCEYWNVELAQLQWEPGDYWARLVNYNLSQVHYEKDGSVRFIASWQDPGLPNWFDCSGRNLHLIGFRFFECNTEQAEPRVKTVPFAELADHISQDMPRISKEQRQEQMEKRLVSVYRRRFSDF